MSASLEADQLQLDARRRDDAVAIRAEVADGTQIIDALVVYRPVAPAAANVADVFVVAAVGVAYVAHAAQRQVSLDPVVSSVVPVRRQTLTQQTTVCLHGQMLLDADTARVAEHAVDDVFAADVTVRRLREDVSDAPAVALADVARRDLVVLVSEAPVQLRDQERDDEPEHGRRQVHDGHLEGRTRTTLRKYWNETMEHGRRHVHDSHLEGRTRTTLRKYWNETMKPSTVVVRYTTAIWREEHALHYVSIGTRR